MLIASPRRHVACGASEYRSDASKASVSPETSAAVAAAVAASRSSAARSLLEPFGVPAATPAGTEARLLRAIEPLGERTGLPRAAPRWNEPSSDRSSSDSTTLSRRASAESAAVGRSLSVGPKGFGPKDVGISPDPTLRCVGGSRAALKKTPPPRTLPPRLDAPASPVDPAANTSRRTPMRAAAVRTAWKRARHASGCFEELSNGSQTRFTRWPRHITTSPSDRMCRWPPIMPAGHSRPPFSGDDCTASRFTSCSR